MLTFTHYNNMDCMGVDNKFGFPFLDSTIKMWNQNKVANL